MICIHITYHSQYDQTLELTTLVVIGTNYMCNQCISSLKLWVRISFIENRIGGVMVNVLASSAVDRGFEPRSSHTKDYKTGIYCFFAKHGALSRKSKDWLARNQNKVSEWSDMSTRGLLFQWASTTKIQLCVLIQDKVNIISSKCNLFLPWYIWKIPQFPLNNNHS